MTIDKLALLAASAVTAFVAISPAEAGAYTKARRYSAFSCFAVGKPYTINADAPKPLNTAGQGVTGSDNYLFCPHVSSEDFGLADVNSASVSLYHYGNHNNHRVRACTSWASFSNNQDNYGYACGTWLDGGAVGDRSNSLTLTSATQLSAWHDAPAWYAYLIVDMAGSGVQSDVVGYKISD